MDKNEHSENKNTNEYSEYSNTEKKYLETLSDVEKQAFRIAKEHLGSSFDLSKSIGYKKWEPHYNTNQ